MPRTLRDVIAHLGLGARGPTREDDLARAFDEAHRKYVGARGDTYRDATSQEERIVELEREVARLSTALLAILHRLHHDQVLDARVVGQDVVQALSALDGPLRDLGPDDPSIVICAKCKKHVPRATTYVTGRGTMCEACWDGRA
jgi:hypothetical protein